MIKKLDLGNRNVQIVSVEGKDVLTRDYSINDKTLRIGSLDYSMETDKLRKLGKNIIKKDKKTGRYYTYSIINVTFNYACKGEKDLSDEEYERLNSLQIAYELTNNKDEKKYIKELINNAKRNINKKDIRYQLYKYGFNIRVNGKIKHYVRYKRTSGSARVGKCLFIEENIIKK